MLLCRNVTAAFRNLPRPSLMISALGGIVHSSQVGAGEKRRAAYISPALLFIYSWDFQRNQTIYLKKFEERLQTTLISLEIDGDDTASVYKSLLPLIQMKMDPLFEASKEPIISGFSRGM